jgi:hypothetical protein
VAVAETHLVRGRPDREIVDLGEEVGAGFIVMGSRALGGVRRALMGRVSDPSSGTLTAASWSSDTEVAWPSDRGIRLRLAKCWSPLGRSRRTFHTPCPHAPRVLTPLLTPLRAQHPETAGNREQRKSAYLSHFCNIGQRPETRVSGLWH